LVLTRLEVHVASWRAGTGVATHEMDGVELGHRHRIPLDQSTPVDPCDQLIARRARETVRRVGWSGRARGARGADRFAYHRARGEYVVSATRVNSHRKMSVDRHRKMSVDGRV
ncbi:MAG TPA: hypothetical protein VFT22_29660, partial [Kofleriaceae bacterium]|nr:hypothetical protein [Kofleriaceae bacterium]